MISFISAPERTWGTVQQRDCIVLTQTCDNCSFSNITSIQFPNKTSYAIKGETVMEKVGTLYNYTYCGTDSLGQYIVTGHGDDDGIDTIWRADFEVSPTGLPSNLGFYIIVLILSLGIIIFGVTRNDPIITLLGSFGLYFLGLYILFNGIVGVKDLVTTWAIGIIMLGLAMYVSIKSAHALITE